MKPFRATYTPKKWVDRGGYVPDTTKVRTVLILALGQDNEGLHAFFIDDDNSLKAGSLDSFTNCQSSEWRE